MAAYNEVRIYDPTGNVSTRERSVRPKTSSFFTNFFQDSAEDFALPFHNDVGPDPSFEEMKKVVCIDNRRPEFLDSWRKSQVLSNANLDWVGATSSTGGLNFAPQTVPKTGYP